ncbi:MAG: YqcC family protein [Halopseudomonas sp.]
MDQHRQVAILLTEIESELRQQDLWTSMPPPPEALQSIEPFSVDTLMLNEWLQWICIPRMKALLDARRPLPGNCQILPIAEESFNGLVQDCSALLKAIEAFDKALS